MVNRATSAIEVSVEQKRRIKGVLLYQKIWQEIHSYREQAGLCDEALSSLNLFADQLVNEGKDIPALIGKAISVIRRRREAAEYGMKTGYDRLQSILPLLNGGFVEGWGPEDPFVSPFNTTENLMSLVLNGDTICEGILPK